MALLNFPTNPAPGQLYTLGNVTYTWNGSAWLKVNQGNQVFNQLTSTNIVVNAPTTATVGLTVNGSVSVTGTLNIGGKPALTADNFLPGADIQFATSGTVTTINNTSTLQTVTGRGATTTNVVYFTNATESTSTTTGAVVISGGIGVAKRVTAESVRIADAVFDSTVMTINSTDPTVIDTFSFNQYRSAKYLIQIDEGSNSGDKSQVTEGVMLVTNTGTVNFLEYGNIMPDGDLGEFQADYANLGYDKVVTLKFVAWNSTPKTVKVLRTAMAV